MKPPKEIAIGILGKAKKDDEDDAGDEPEMPDGKEVAQEFLDAVEAKDPEAVWKAFRGMTACAEHEPEDDDEEPEGDDEE